MGIMTDTTPVTRTSRPPPPCAWCGQPPRAGLGSEDGLEHFCSTACRTHWTGLQVMTENDDDAESSRSAQAS